MRRGSNASSGDPGEVPDEEINAHLGNPGLNARLPFKHLRKTAATIMGSHPLFRAYAQYFLGHTPETVADVHYIRRLSATTFQALFRT
jgi:hypothetical protein